MSARGRIRLSGPREIFSLDLRSLALFRLGLGLVLVFDLCSRLGDVRAHYTDYGILPRVLHVQDYALLVGSLGLFLVLALLMYATRKVDWYRVGRPAPSP